MFVHPLKLFLINKYLMILPDGAVSSFIILCERRSGLTEPPFPNEDERKSADCNDDSIRIKRVCMAI